jgi:chitinase
MAINHYVNKHACEKQSVTILVTVAGVGGATVHGRLVVCYVSTWSVYRAGRGSWSLDNLDPTLCTHLVYAFAGLDNNTNTIRSLDEYHDLEDNYGKGGLCKVVMRKWQ